MAKRGINSLSELHRMKHMQRFSYTTIYNFANNIHKNFHEKLVVAICKELNCGLGELLYVDRGTDSGER